MLSDAKSRHCFYFICKHQLPKKSIFQPCNQDLTNKETSRLKKEEMKQLSPSFYKHLFRPKFLFHFIFFFLKSGFVSTPTEKFQPTHATSHTHTHSLAHTQVHSHTRTHFFAGLIFLLLGGVWVLSLWKMTSHEQQQQQQQQQQQVQQPQ